MTTALVLLLASAIVGLATALFFTVWSLLLVSPAVALVAAIVLQTSGFGFWPGIPIVVGSLIACQFAYLAGAFLTRGVLTQDESDDAPGDHGQ